MANINGTALRDPKLRDAANRVRPLRMQWMLEGGLESILGGFLDAATALWDYGLLRTGYGSLD